MAAMEGRGPYRIYDPGGGTEENGSTAFERLIEENARLKERMQGIKSIGNHCMVDTRPRGWGLVSESLSFAACAAFMSLCTMGCGRTETFLSSWGVLQLCHPLFLFIPLLPSTPYFAFSPVTQLLLSSPSASAAELPPPS